MKMRKTTESHTIEYYFALDGAPVMETERGDRFRPKSVYVRIVGDKQNAMGVQHVTIRGWHIKKDGTEGYTSRVAVYSQGMDVPKWLRDELMESKYHALIHLWLQL